MKSRERFLRKIGDKRFTALFCMTEVRLVLQANSKTFLSFRPVMCRITATN